MPPPAIKIKKLLDGQISMYARPPAMMWQYAFTVGKQNVRRSSKTTDFDKASSIAIEAYIDARALDRAGVTIVTHTFKSVADLAVNSMKSAMSEGKGKDVFKSYITALNKYYIPYFGSKNIENITVSDLSKFSDWRREQFGGNPASSTITSHISALNRVFDVAVERKFLTRSQLPEQTNDGEDAERRPDFTKDEITKLRDFMPKWIARGKKGHPTSTREILRDYCEFLIHTGARPGTELAGLKWKHIRYDESSGIPHLCVAIRDGKVGRREISMTHAAIRELQRCADRNKKLKGVRAGVAIEKQLDEFVFAFPDGSEIKNIRQPFAVMIKESGLEVDPRSGDNRTLYSFRHFFISDALSRGATSEEVAPHCGTSIPMINKFYYHPDLLATGRKLAKLGGLSPNALLDAD